MEWEKNGRSVGEKRGRGAKVNIYNKGTYIERFYITI